MIPALIAGGVALAGAGLNYYNQKKAGERTEDMYDAISDEAARVEELNQGDIDQYQKFLESYYGDDAGKYSEALQRFMDSDVYQNPNFAYDDKTVSDFLDPSRNQRVEAAMRALERQGADGGNSWSSDYMQRMAGQQAAMASEEWKDAYNRLVQDRQQQLSLYNTNTQNAWQNYDALTGRAKYGIEQYGGARDNYANGYGSVLAAGMQNREAGLQSQANAAAGIMQGQNQQSGALGALIGPAAQFAGAYFGANN